MEKTVLFSPIRSIAAIAKRAKSPVASDARWVTLPASGAIEDFLK